jgi:magnesium transporter
VKQSEELCNIVLKSIRSLRDSYQSMFANNLHKTIKLLTALTIILNIPTMIASIYGMNVNLPLVNHSYAFEIIVAVILIASALGFYIFKRKKWM